MDRFAFRDRRHDDDRSILDIYERIGGGIVVERVSAETEDGVRGTGDDAANVDSRRPTRYRP